MSDPSAPSAQLDVSVLADLRALGTPDEDVLAELVDLFLADVPVQLLALRMAIDACDTESTWHVAHRLKGTALGMGARLMASISGTVESEARAGALAVAAIHAKELVIEFESTRRALEREVRA